MKKTIITVTGPSGAGKSTLFEKILGKENEITSFTTRQRRVKAGEIDGIHYHFITKEKFAELDENGGLFEKSEYAGEFYGITEDEFKKKIKNDCYFVTNLDGLQQIKVQYEKVFSVFVYTNREDIEKQLKERGDEEEKIKIRLKTYDEDMKVMKEKNQFDLIIENKYGEMEKTIEIIKEKLGKM